MPPNFSISLLSPESMSKPINSANYCILMLNEACVFDLDFTPYQSQAESLLFLSPYQNLTWKSQVKTPIPILEFHGDFYCIEYHKKEVACNGLLFNNVYLHPHFAISTHDFAEIQSIYLKMQAELSQDHPFTKSVLTAYLQLILAISSKIKSQLLQDAPLASTQNSLLHQFQDLVELHFLHERSPSFYAEKLATSPTVFARKIKAEIGKSPLQVLQDRLVLEAKKLLHLSQKSVKEIAAELHLTTSFILADFLRKM